jgi:Fe-S oxidoreductase
MGELLFGVDAERSVPPFARQTFQQWFRDQTWGTSRSPGPRVVLFADSFNAYHTPQPLQAAAQFLDATGHRVELPGPRTCCGRTLLSKGHIPEAQRRALQTVEALYPYADDGVPIVGLEPSCILTLRDEFLDLLPGEPRAELVAEHVCTFEEYVARRAAAGAFEHLDWQNGIGNVLLHGHCHQKALIGTDATERALTLPGYHVDAVDAGCCGMAGSFGYEAEHVDVSREMAELRLAPAVREVDDDTAIAATGFSCRSQIKDVTARTARHPAELLWVALAKEGKQLGAFSTSATTGNQ